MCFGTGHDQEGPKHKSAEPRVAFTDIRRHSDGFLRAEARRQRRSSLATGAGISGSYKVIPTVIHCAQVAGKERTPKKDRSLITIRNSPACKATLK